MAISLAYIKVGRGGHFAGSNAFCLPSRAWGGGEVSTLDNLTRKGYVPLTRYRFFLN